MTNQINANGIYDEQIDNLKSAIEYLKESDNKLGFEDDGSGKQYSIAQKQIGYKYLSDALDYISKAQMVLMRMERMYKEEKI